MADMATLRMSEGQTLKWRYPHVDFSYSALHGPYISLVAHHEGFQSLPTISNWPCSVHYAMKVQLRGTDCLIRLFHRIPWHIRHNHQYTLIQSCRTFS